MLGDEEIWTIREETLVNIIFELLPTLRLISVRTVQYLLKFQFSQGVFYTGCLKKTPKQIGVFHHSLKEIGEEIVI